MSLFGSLFSGVSGLSAQSRSMSMISDNVANVNTTAYKGAAAQFASLVTRQPSSATYSPGGVRSFTSYSIGSQGLIQSSASPTDAAISGSGFFVVNSQAAGGGEQLYTRAGSFSTDFLGNLRTPSGQFLQGWALDADERIVDINSLETVNIRIINGLAAATTTVQIGANLNADQAAFAGAYAAGDMAAYNASGGSAGVQPQFFRDVQVYDSLGRPQNVTMAFIKDPAANTWNVEVFAAAGAVETAQHPNGLLATGTVTFQGDGGLASVALTPAYPAGAAAGDPVGVDWLDLDGAEDSAVTFDFGSIGSTDGLTQFASDNSVAYVTQNGAEVGELNGVSLNEDGYVIASFTNGEERKLYRLPIATFANPAALDPRSGNIFAQTDASGEFNLRFSGSGGAGTVTPSALEAANVDLADEFTKMIVTQRAYSANARIITTTDEMLDELIRISR
jgi:flagellar hook protein FlgE